MKDGQPFMITGSPGGDDQVMITLQTLVNVIDFGMNVQQAIEAPRWSTHSFPSSPFPHTMVPGAMSGGRAHPRGDTKRTHGARSQVAGRSTLVACVQRRHHYRSEDRRAEPMNPPC